MNRTTRQRLDAIDRNVAGGLMTPAEARDEQILVRLAAVADSRQARLNAPSR